MQRQNSKKHLHKDLFSVSIINDKLVKMNVLFIFGHQEFGGLNLPTCSLHDLLKSFDVLSSSENVILGLTLSSSSRILRL